MMRPRRRQPRSVGSTNNLAQEITPFQGLLGGLLLGSVLIFTVFQAASQPPRLRYIRDSISELGMGHQIDARSNLVRFGLVQSGVELLERLPKHPPQLKKVCACVRTRKQTHQS